MSDNEPDQEPSIEEILSSIRQIISDDDEEEIDDPQPEPTSEPEAETEPEEEPEEILELTDVLDGETPEPEDDEPERFEIDMLDSDDSDDLGDNSIMTDAAANATLAGFSKIAGSLPIGQDGITVEGIVRELLKPMLREWLDSNLPPMIEKLVREELQKLSSQAIDE